MSRSARVRGYVHDALFASAVLGAVYAAKAGYRSATADDLRWMLGPTATLVELSTDARFEYEAGAGYLEREARFLLAPACAGVNFLLAAFLTGTFGFWRRYPRPLERMGLFVGAALGAWMAAVTANAVRIGFALRFHTGGPPITQLSAEELHRLLGIVVYVTCLCAAYLLASLLLSRRAKWLGVPLAAYLFTSLLLPWLNRAGSEEAFWEHATVVLAGALSVGAALWGTVLALRAAYRAAASGASNHPADGGANDGRLRYFSRGGQ